jgi:hypothetical protein
MASQPNVAGVWEVELTDLEAHDPPGAVAPSMIVDSGSPFQLSVEVEGKGSTWNFIEGLAPNFTVTYYAERFGEPAATPPTGEADLPPVTVPFVAGQGTYEHPATTVDVPAGTLIPGVYRIMCMAHFAPGHTAFPDEELLIEVF